MDIKKIRKILVLRYRFVGDTVLLVPFLRNLRQEFPNLQIDVLVSLNSGELIEGNPDVNKVIYYDSTDFHKYEKAGSGTRDGKIVYNSLLGCAAGLRKENYDLIFVLKRSFSSALLAFLINARYRVGFSTEFRSFLLTHTVQYDKSAREIDNFLGCLKTLNLVAKVTNPVIYPTQDEVEKAKGFLVRLHRFKPKVLIHAPSAHPYKVWPKRYFAMLMDALFEELDAQFVFTGAKSDKLVYEEILSWCKSRKKLNVLNLCGLTTLRECYAIYKGLDLAICVDSGNAHIAASAGIPVYVLYGPTDPRRWLPIGEHVFPVSLSQMLSCQPCDLKVDCSHLSCMKLLRPGIVFRNLNTLREKLPVYEA